MLCRSEFDDGDPPPRWQALNDLCDAKERLAAPESHPVREAACEAKPARRTRKPREPRKD
jgi:hypothetical protein